MIATLRAAVKAAVVSLVPAGTEVLEARIPAASFALTIRPPGVVISYAGKPKREAGPVGNRGKQGYVFAFTIVIVDMNVQTPVEALHQVTDIAELLNNPLASTGAAMDLRMISLGTYCDQELFLRFVSEAGDGPGVAEGGKYALVQQWETNEVRM